MDAEEVHERKLRQSRHTAQVAASVFGLALLVWGLAPALVQRLIADEPPTPQALTMGALSFAFGSGFMLLALLISRHKPWALWAALLASSVVLAGAMGFTIFVGARALSVFPVIFAGCTALTCWLALAARRATAPVERAEQPPANPS